MARKKKKLVKKREEIVDSVAKQIKESSKSGARTVRRYSGKRR